MRLEKLEWDHIVKDLEGYAKDFFLFYCKGRAAQKGRFTI